MMSNYYHGAKASKQATSVSTPVVADSSIHIVVGTAPLHTVGGKVNEPVYASNYAEAVAAMVGFKYFSISALFPVKIVFSTNPVFVVGPI